MKLLDDFVVFVNDTYGIVATVISLVSLMILFFVGPVALIIFAATRGFVELAFLAPLFIVGALFVQFLCRKNRNAR